jgi:hypothetical protein
MTTAKNRQEGQKSAQQGVENGKPMVSGGFGVKNAQNADNETRAHLRKVQGNGVRTLEDIRLRCRVDEITGCWLWSLCIGTGGTPKVGLPAGVMGEREQVMSTAKASWLLSGRKLQAGQVVWRAHCGDHRCVNPQHCVALSRADMRKACGESNREKGSLKRAASNRAVAAAQAVKPDVVAEVEKRLKQGKKQREIAAELTVSRDTVHRISSGKHVFSAGRTAPLLRASSVFTWGMTE